MVLVDFFCVIVFLKYFNLKGRSYFIVNLKILVNILFYIYWRIFDLLYIVIMEILYF